jgi:hypothetical protein
MVDFSKGYVLVECLRKFFKHWPVACVSAVGLICLNVIDGGTFIVVKKRVGERDWKNQAGGKGTKKLMAISDSSGLPVSVYITSTASPHLEVTTLTKATLSKCFVFNNEKPERLIGDKEYDSDPLDVKLTVEYGVELISSHRFNRQRSRTQDGRPLRHCYKRSWWKVKERLFA